MGPDSLPGSSTLSSRTDATSSRPYLDAWGEHKGRPGTGRLAGGFIFRWRVTATGASAIRVSAFQPSAIGFGILAADPRTAGA